MSKSSKFVITIKKTDSKAKKEDGPIHIKPIVKNIPLKTNDKALSIDKPDKQVKTTPNVLDTSTKTVTIKTVSVSGKKVSIKEPPIKTVPVKIVPVKIVPVKILPAKAVPLVPVVPVVTVNAKIIKSMVNTHPNLKISVKSDTIVKDLQELDEMPKKETNTIKVILEDTGTRQGDSNELGTSSLGVRKTLFQQGTTMQPRKIIKKPLKSGGTIITTVKEANTNATNSTNKVESDVEIKDTKALVEDCINIISQCDPNQNCSKDELIARVAYQYKTLVKQENSHNEKKTEPSELDIERRQKIVAMQKILTDLNAAWNKEHMGIMADVREKQDQIVLKNKMEKKMFVMKIDLTSEKKPGEVAKHVALLTDSREHWKKESKKIIGPPPPKVKAEFGRYHQNAKLPADIQKRLYGK